MMEQESGKAKHSAVLIPTLSMNLSMRLRNHPISLIRTALIPLIVVKLTGKKRFDVRLNHRTHWWN